MFYIFSLDQDINIVFTICFSIDMEFCFLFYPTFFQYHKIMTLWNQIKCPLKRVGGAILSTGPYLTSLLHFFGIGTGPFKSLNSSMSMTVILAPCRGPLDERFKFDPLGSRWTLPPLCFMFYSALGPFFARKLIFLFPHPC